MEQTTTPPEQGLKLLPEEASLMGSDLFGFATKEMSPDQAHRILNILAQALDISFQMSDSAESRRSGNLKYYNFWAFAAWNPHVTQEHAIEVYNAKVHREFKSTAWAMFDESHKTINTYWNNRCTEKGLPTHP